MARGRSGSNCKHKYLLEEFICTKITIVHVFSSKQKFLLMHSKLKYRFVIIHS